MSGINLNDWAGLLFSGVAMSVALYGLSCAQTLFYYKEYPQDSVFLKSFVGFLWFLDSARTIMDVSSLWFWVVKNHACFAQLIVIPGEFAAEFFLAKVTIISVQCYFIWTIWRLLAGTSLQRPLSLLGLVLALLAFGAGLAQAVQMARDNNAITTIPDNLVSGVLGLGAAFATDTYITICLCVVLYGSKTGFSRTEGMISRLLSYAVARGMFTALFQLASTITFGVFIHSASVPWALVIIPGNAVYSNSLLSALNTRHHLRDVHAEFSLRDIDLHGLSFTTTGQSRHEIPAQSPSDSSGSATKTPRRLGDDSAVSW